VPLGAYAQTRGRVPASPVQHRKFASGCLSSCSVDGLNLRCTRSKACKGRQRATRSSSWIIHRPPETLVHHSPGRSWTAVAVYTRHESVQQLALAATATFRAASQLMRRSPMVPRNGILDLSMTSETRCILRQLCVPTAWKRVRARVHKRLVSEMTASCPEMLENVLVSLVLDPNCSTADERPKMDGNTSLSMKYGYARILEENALPGACQQEQPRHERARTISMQRRFTGCLRAGGIRKLLDLDASFHKATLIRKR
jgi:hypothetical protein